MAATGEPYTVAARALDAEPTASASAERASAAAEQAEEPAAEPTAAEPTAAEPTAAEPTAAESAAAEPTAAESAAAEAVADPGRAADQAEALAEVIACAGRTLAASSARLQIQTDTDLGRDPDERIPRRRRRGPLGRLAGRAAKAVWERAAPDTEPAEVWQQFLHQFGSGFIEPAAGRYLVDFGGYAQVLVGGRRFGGLSGQPLGRRYEQRPHRFRRADPLDVLRQLQGATAAGWTGEERVRWATCRVALVTAGSDEFTVWVDGQRILRFRTIERGEGRSVRATKTETVEFWDFGVPVDELDWSRLPSFRTPAPPQTVGD
jgi:hypothetical protein